MSVAIGQVAYVKITGEQVFIEQQEPSTLGSRIVFTVRRALETREEKLVYTHDQFQAEELETFEEKLEREAAQGRLILGMRRAVEKEAYPQMAAASEVAKPN